MTLLCATLRSPPRPLSRLLSSSASLIHSNHRSIDSARNPVYKLHSSHRALHTTTPRAGSPLFALGALSNSRESQYFRKTSGLSAVEHSPNLQLIRDSEVVPFGGPDKVGPKKEGIKEEGKRERYADARGPGAAGTSSTGVADTGTIYATPSPEPTQESSTSALKLAQYAEACANQRKIVHEQKSEVSRMKKMVKQEKGVLRQKTSELKQAEDMLKYGEEPRSNVAFNFQGVNNRFPPSARNSRRNKAAIFWGLATVVAVSAALFNAARVEEVRKSKDAELEAVLIRAAQTAAQLEDLRNKATTDVAKLEAPRSKISEETATASVQSITIVEGPGAVLPAGKDTKGWRSWFWSYP